MDKARREEENKLDKEANTFARHLLMPTKMIRPQLKKISKRNPSYDSSRLVKEMAKVFEVPIEQMSIRLYELNILI